MRDKLSILKIDQEEGQYCLEDLFSSTPQLPFFLCHLQLPNKIRQG